MENDNQCLSSLCCRGNTFLGSQHLKNFLSKATFYAQPYLKERDENDLSINPI